MKKVIPLLLLLVLSLPLQGADTGFSFGMKVSPNISWMRPETRGYEMDGVRFGLGYGLVVDYGFADNYAVSTGLTFLHSGGKLEYHYFDQDTPTLKKRKFDLNYVELPITLRLKTTEIGFIRYYGQFGFSLGFNTKAWADDRIGDGQWVKDIPVEDEIAFLKASLVIGGGVLYGLGGRTALMGGITFSNGFSNMLDTSNPAVPHDPSALLKYVEITFGVMF